MEQTQEFIPYCCVSHSPMPHTRAQVFRASVVSAPQGPPFGNPIVCCHEPVVRNRLAPHRTFTLGIMSGMSVLYIGYVCAMCVLKIW